GKGVTIAEIDTGVNAALPELRTNVLRGKDFGEPGDGRVDRETSEFGHGTAMASIMVGHTGIFGVTGIAPDAKVLPIAVPLIGTTDAQQDDSLADAIRWGADHGGKIISMSLGGRRTKLSGVDPCPVDEQEAIYHALRKGAIVVAASGNNGPSSNSVEEPGVCLGVVSVGAVDSSGTVASFSSRHPYLTLTAPGVNIPSLSRVPGTAYAGDGTSQATAIASAVFALVWSKFPKLTNREVLARVLATLDRKRATRDPAYGYGTINAARAVTANLPASLPNPVFAAADPFLDRDQAFADAARVPVPRPPGKAKVNVGQFSIGSSPRLFVPKVLGGLAVAAAGLVLLVGLAIAGWISRRRRPAVVPAGPGNYGYFPQYPQPGPQWAPMDAAYGTPAPAVSAWGEHLVGVVQFDRPGDAVGHGAPQWVGEQEHHRHDEADVEDAVHDAAQELPNEHLPPAGGPLVADVIDPHAGELLARRLPATPDDERPDDVTDDQGDHREHDLE
ncbi:MAG TPA: S8 family serine peptidase, partial [Jatrophihabitantaceae bacterium]|nr:S8 family serine peptidase [Jatrophihabitantaceae bacterium]